MFEFAAFTGLHLAVYFAVLGVGLVAGWLIGYDDGKADAKRSAGGASWKKSLRRRRSLEKATSR